MPLVTAAATSRWRPLSPSTLVREQPRHYEDEGSVREARGAVTVARDAWWSATLSVAVGGAPSVARLRLRRHGPGVVDRAGGSELDLVLAADEVTAMVTLLDGVARQARRDGVLPPAGG